MAKRPVKARGEPPRVTAEDWQAHAYHIHETVGKKWEAYSPEDRRYNVLSLAGEAGEVLNLIKKDWRGDPGNRWSDLLFEFADCRIYLELLVKCYDMTFGPFDHRHFDGLLRTDDEKYKAGLYLSKVTGDICEDMLFEWNVQGNVKDYGIRHRIKNVQEAIERLAWLYAADLDLACATKVRTL